MDTIQWESRFSVGNRSIDAQHKRLFDIFNSLAQNLHASPDSEKIADLVNQLGSYVSYHFSLEQKYMEEIGYPDIQSHIKQHEDYIKRVLQLNRDAMNAKYDVPKDMFDFLQTWLLNHVLKSDQQVGEYARQHQRQKTVLLLNGTSSVAR